MKRKKLWISILAVALLAPSLVLCFLMLSADDFTLKDFASCSSLSLTDAAGEVTEVQAQEENFLLLTSILSLAETSGKKRVDASPSWLYTVKSGDGKYSCRLGIDDGEAAVSWKDSVYVLSFPHLRSGDTVMYPCLVRYGIESGEGYIDAPLLSQNTETVYSLHSPADFSSISFDAPCEFVSLDVFLYAQGAQEPSASFDTFDAIVFDEASVWTIVINAEVTMDTYRVQCGYELIYAPN